MILERFYKGKIYPGEQTITFNSERCRREATFDANYQRLIARVDESVKKECIALLEEANAISAYDCEQAYIEGMRMGARLAAELLMDQE